MAGSDKENEFKKFSFSARLKSFLNAFAGLSVLFRYEHNFRTHIVIMLCVIIAGFIFKISAAEWIQVIIASGMVLAAESLNSALEYLSDAISTESSPKLKKAKDVAAASVLITAIFAIIVGLIIFIPKIVLLVQHLLSG